MSHVEVEHRAIVERREADGVAVYRVTVARWTHAEFVSQALMRCIWFAEWTAAQAFADLASRAPFHPSIEGLVSTSLAAPVPPRVVAEKLALMGRRAEVPRIGLAALEPMEVCS